MYNSFVESEKENKELREENEVLKQRIRDLQEKIRDYEIFFQKLRIYVFEQEYNNSLMALKEMDGAIMLKIEGRQEAYNDVIRYIKERTKGK